MLDPISEMLTRIRNAQMAGKSQVVLRSSRLKFAVAKILESEGFLGEVAKEKDERGLENIRIELKYRNISRSKKIPFIQGIERVSRESQRVYVKKSDIRPVKNNFGISIISTSKGVMTGDKSRKEGLGGEYICRVW